MTLAKTCHASNMMPDLEKATYRNHKSFLNCDVSIFHYCIEKKIILIYNSNYSDAQQINLKFVVHDFVANFVSYISAKYYLKGFSFHIVFYESHRDEFF